MLLQIMKAVRESLLQAGPARPESTLVKRWFSSVEAEPRPEDTVTANAGPRRNKGLNGLKNLLLTYDSFGDMKYHVPSICVYSF